MKYIIRLLKKEIEYFENEKKDALASTKQDETPNYDLVEAHFNGILHGLQHAINKIETEYHLKGIK